MDVQAMIMAGGEGVRLRPLTVYLPKPLVPLVGEPVMGYSLKLLKKHGISDVGVTLWYRPRDIRNVFGRGEKYGVKIKYYEESRPMGTAGSMRMAKDHLKNTFFVLSGDGLTDCDLTAALAFHREKKALATLVLRRVRVPLPYGVVLCNEENRVTRFIEKPAWNRVFSNLVNTGIYILEPEIFDYISDHGAPDFGRDLFPALVQSGLPVYGYETAAYWCDIGDLNAYVSAQRALLQGETAFSVPIGVDEGARVDPSARIEGACAIGKGAVVGPGAVIRNAVIGQDCVVGGGAVLENVCLWERASAGEKSRLTGCVLCCGAAARQGADLGVGCALGEAAVAGAGAKLLPGVRIWPHLKAQPASVVKRSLVDGDSVTPQWTANGVSCDTAEDACCLMRAFGQALKCRRVMAAWDEEGAALADVLCGALTARGIRVLSAGEMTVPMQQALIRFLHLDGGVFAGKHHAMLLDGAGELLSSRLKAAINDQVLRGQNEAEFARIGERVSWTGSEEIYLSLALIEGEKPLLSRVAVYCASDAARRVVRQGMERMNVRFGRLLQDGREPPGPGETGIFLSPDGKGMEIRWEENVLGEGQTKMLLLKLLHRKNGILFDLPGTPRSAARLSPLLQEDQSEKCAYQRMVMGDGIAALFLLCDALKEGPLDHWLKELPETYILTREIPCMPEDKGRILHSLCDGSILPREMGDGVRFRHENGFATVTPDGYRNAVKITSEAAKYELAGELCDFYLDQIRRITNLP